MLDIQSLTAGYGRIEIVHNVSFAVEDGSITTILGPNGSGKSTLVKSIFGLSTIFSGNVSFNGIDITAMRADRIIRQGISYVPQVDNVFPNMNIEENLQLGILSDLGSFSQRVEFVYQMFPVLNRKRTEKAKTLSGGERQMVALGRALMTKPRLLFLDEPSVGLSPKLADELYLSIGKLANNNISIALVEQNVKAALSLSHKAIVLNSGEKVFEGSSQVLLGQDIGNMFLKGK